jgi:hypothetical protein
MQWTNSVDQALGRLDGPGIRGIPCMRKLVPYARFFQMGWVVAFSLLIPLAVGLALDLRFGLRPWGTVAALLIGSLAAMYTVVRMTFDFYRTIEETPPAARPRKSYSSVKEDESE